jgi:hypothetical protein
MILISREGIEGCRVVHQHIQTKVYATATAPTATATSAITLFAVSTLPAVPVDVAVADAAVAATPAFTRVAVCVMVSVSRTFPDTVEVTTTVRVEMPVVSPVTVYQPLLGAP